MASQHYSRLRPTVQSAVAAVATVISIVIVVCGIGYFVYGFCIIKRVWVSISLVSSSSLTTQLTTRLAGKLHGSVSDAGGYAADTANVVRLL